MKREVWTTLLVLICLVSVNAQQTQTVEYGSYRFTLTDYNAGYQAASTANDESAMAYYDGIRNTLDRGGGLIYVQIGSSEQNYLQSYSSYGNPSDRYRVVDGTVERYSWFNDIYSDGWVADDEVTPANLGVQQVSFLPGSAEGSSDYYLTSDGVYCPV